jgi:hypothetical protein
MGGAPRLTFFFTRMVGRLAWDEDGLRAAAGRSRGFFFAGRDLAAARGVRVPAFFFFRSIRALEPLVPFTFTMDLSERRAMVGRASSDSRSDD